MKRINYYNFQYLHKNSTSEHFLDEFCGVFPGDDAALHGDRDAFHRREIDHVERKNNRLKRAGRRHDGESEVKQMSLCLGDEFLKQKLFFAKYMVFGDVAKEKLCGAGEIFVGKALVHISGSSFRNDCTRYKGTQRRVGKSQQRVRNLKRTTFAKERAVE
jgi:hypothetical protein